LQAGDVPRPRIVKSYQMPPRKRQQNTVASLQRKDDSDFERSTARIDERKRRMDRFDFWLFLSIWMVITATALLGIASQYH